MHLFSPQNSLQLDDRLVLLLHSSLATIQLRAGAFLNRCERYLDMRMYYPDTARENGIVVFGPLEPSNDPDYPFSNQWPFSLRELCILPDQTSCCHNVVQCERCPLVEPHRHPYVATSLEQQAAHWQMLV